MTASFDYKSHHQAISQNLKKTGTYSAKSSVYTGFHLNFIYRFTIINSLNMCNL